MSTENRRHYRLPIATFLPACAGLSLVLGLGLAQLALAEMYRWVDENGVTVYSQHPPADAPSTTIAPPPAPSSTEAERAYKRIKDQMVREFDAREDKKKQTEEQAKSAEEQAMRDQNCAAARANLRTLENLGARRLRTPDGDYRRISGDERADKIETMRKAIEENCN